MDRTAFGLHNEDIILLHASPRHGPSLSLCVREMGIEVGPGDRSREEAYRQVVRWLRGRGFRRKGVAAAGLLEAAPAPQRLGRAVCDCRCSFLRLMSRLLNHLEKPQSQVILQTRASRQDGGTARPPTRRWPGLGKPGRAPVTPVRLGAGGLSTPRTGHVGELDPAQARPPSFRGGCACLDEIAKSGRTGRVSTSYS